MMGLKKFEVVADDSYLPRDIRLFCHNGPFTSLRHFDVRTLAPVSERSVVRENIQSFVTKSSSAFIEGDI